MSDEEDDHDDDNDDDEEDEDGAPARKKQRSGGGGGKRCVCGESGCMKKVNVEGFRLPAKMNKRLSWLHCFYPSDAVPAEFTEAKPVDRRVHPCHFRSEDLELKDRGGSS